MKLEDAIFNYLQIKIVSDARPDDKAAKDTMHFFEEILRDDHKLANVHITEREDLLQVHFEHEGSQQVKSFDREIAQQLLVDINSNPKYNE